jgi:hypothetical protein
VNEKLKTPLIDKIRNEEQLGWKIYEEFPQQAYFETINKAKRLRNKLPR